MTYLRYPLVDFLDAKEHSVEGRARRSAYLVVLRKERVASELGATDAPEPKARYVRLTLARCSFVLLWLAEAAGGSEEAEAVDVCDGAIATL